MYNRKSEYALNKLDPDAIVYRDTDGGIVRLTREDFASEEEFQLSKRWSDDDLHEIEKEEHIYHDHTWSMSGLPATACPVPSAEQEVEATHVRRQRLRLQELQMKALRAILSEKQFQRLWLYHGKGMTVRAIAKIEQISF